MLTKWLFRIVLGISSVWLVNAASVPVGTVTSTETSHGVQSYPLSVGDEVSSGSATAIILFTDGSSVKLAPGSKARLMGSEDLPKFVLLAGSLDYKLVLGSNVSITNLDIERARKLGAPAAVKPLHTPNPDAITFTSR